MLDFIYMGSPDPFGTGRERKIQIENICFKRDSNPHYASPRQESQRFKPLDHAGKISSGTFIFLLYALRVTIFMTSPLGVAVGLLSI